LHEDFPILALRRRRASCVVFLGRSPQEAAMHIHGINPGSAYLDSLSSSEKAASATRAEEARKKLLRDAQSLTAQSAPAESHANGTLWLGQWNSARNNEGLGGDEYHPTLPGKDPDFG
jgi:hypothetical protein